MEENKVNELKMKELLSISQVRTLDRKEGKKDDPLFLMEKAALGAYKALKKNLHFHSALVVCGGGNNGGDGLALSRLLFEGGYQVQTVLLAGPRSLENLLEEKRLPFKTLTELPSGSFDVIVDAIYGIGFHQPMDDETARLIESLNASKAYKVSLDLPSGLQGDNGLGKISFKADLTLTFGAYKSGLFLNDGLDVTGKIVMVPLYNEKTEGIMKTIEKSDLKKLIKKRNRNTNKGDYLSFTVLGGSLDYLGAPFLAYSALAGLRMGAGYARLAVPKETYPFYALKAPQAILEQMPSKDGHLVFEESYLKHLCDKSAAIAFGMGAINNEETYQIACYLVRNFSGLLILDADALNALSAHGLSVLKETRPGQLILTPHLKEFSRLCGKEVEEIEGESISLAADFASSYHLTLILKSASSIITDGQESYLNISGNSGLAKGGSGDLLCGIIVGLSYLLKDGLSSLDLCKIASFLLGRTAEIFALKFPQRSLLAEDIIALLPYALKEISPD